MAAMQAAMVKQVRRVGAHPGLTPATGGSAQGGSGVPLDAAPGSQDPPSDIQRTVILASIVEKETSVPEERPMVASVYSNRLAKRIALHADPSFIYAELLAGTYQRGLHHAVMQFRSPYNT